MTEVIAIVGCSAAGKSKITEALKDKVECDIYAVSCDEFYKPISKCPTFDIGTLPWPNGKVPDAFKERGNADLNDPSSVAWMDVLARIHKYQLQIEEKLANTTPKTLPKKSIIVIEGLLLLGDHEGASIVRTEIDKYVVLDSNSEDEDQLCERKYKRSHLSKVSYEQRGVSQKDYRCYWDHYVQPKWVEHGRSRLDEVCPDALHLNCCGDNDDNVKELIETGWFTSKKLKTTKPLEKRKNLEKKQRESLNTKPPETSWPRDSEEDEEDEEIEEDVDDDEVKEEDSELERSGPSLKAFAIATVAAAIASVIEPAMRAGVLAVVLLVYWLWRGRKN